jgi:quercetin dioxygenase-like cupin family protein
MLMAQAQGERDAVTADPQHYTVEADNEQARVLRIRYGPREKSVMHSHPAAVVVFLGDAQVRFTYPDGTSEEIQGQAGQVLAMPATTHLPENLSDRPFEVILVELKA